ncbi:hypothetical protein [Moorena sp. SIO3B2]|uniref:hypothetical protein n=1 Tax=Moorena sp. SIO3B2 TaxID=2607827 RepID=UPI0002FA9544|nr:hypothetical protein [Moorena sp. SIO3B2]OLT65884.1 hypothetical protein BI334_13365 [Moorena producens 3L]
MILVPPRIGGLGGQNSVSKNFSDILLERVDLAMKAARSQMTIMEQALALATALINEQNAQI